MNNLLRVGLLGFAVLGAAIAVWARTHRVNARQDLANRLAMLGYPKDDAGRIVFENGSGLSLAYDPNLHNPAIGFSGCVNGITACFERHKPLDDCVRASPRCVSAIPWKGDPAGELCCPKSCVEDYFERRKSLADDSAMLRMIDGYCYPGMKEAMTGRKE